MRINADQLDVALSQGLKSLYLIHGDEALLVEEAADKVRQSIRQQGEFERDVWHVEGRFDWSQIKWQDQTLSLFASQRIIEIRLPSGSPGKDGGEAFRQFASSPPADTVLLIISGKIDNRSQKAKWFTELDKLGVNVPIWPVDIGRLPAWLVGRMQQRGLKPNRDLAAWIAERVEGNLFAAAQEVEKLSLLSQNGEVDNQLARDTITDNARFEAFGLMDTVYAGNSAKIPRIINRLRADGLDMMALFSAVSWSLRRMMNMAELLQQGMPLQRAFELQKPPVFERARPLVRQCLERHGYQRWQQFIAQLAEIERATKGVVDDCPWRLLEKLCLQAAGTPILET